MCRLISARVNLIHDCDEVYNYWEPLHFLLYGSGMQTWEYRCPTSAGSLKLPGRLECTLGLKALALYLRFGESRLCRCFLAAPHSKPAKHQPLLASNGCGVRSSKYALRSYLYLLLHAAVAGPAALLFGTGAGAQFTDALTNYRAWAQAETKDHNTELTHVKGSTSS